MSAVTGERAGWIRCTAGDDGGCGVIGYASTRQERVDRLWQHHDEVHLGRAPAVVQLEGVTWQDQFIAAVRAIPVGETFTTAELHGRIPDPPHHNHWGSATTVAEHLGLIVAVTAQRSELPTTKASLVNRWRRVEPKGVAA